MAGAAINVLRLLVALPRVLAVLVALAVTRVIVSRAIHANR